MIRALAVMAALSAGLALQAAHAQNAPAAADPFARGRELYTAIGCYQCHGYVGQGGRITGPALLPHLMSPAAFASQLRTPVDHMPPYTAKVLSDPDVAALRDYLASLPPSPDAASISLLNAAKKP